MKCISRKYRRQFYIFFIIISFAGFTLSGCKKELIEVTSYETAHYNQGLYRGELFSVDLCVPPTGDAADNPSINSITSAGMFDLTNHEVIYSEKVYEMVYPASTTKIMTALVALESGKLDELVTISENADAGKFAADEATCGLKSGDQVTLRNLLYALTLNSGNDAAIAIAEHVGGSVQDFCQLMNQKAAELLATHTHFSNPHGLHDDDHYTTAYDLYLIFNAAIAHSEYRKIIETESYNMTLTGADNTERTIKCEPTNLYSLGKAAQPSAATVLGGKTGTTREAGYCLVAYDEDGTQASYISIIMGADSKPLLYSNMTSLIETIDSE